jgi:hypothetical protein
MTYIPNTLGATTLLIGALVAAPPACSQPLGAPVSESASVSTSAIHYTATPGGSESDGPVRTGKRISRASYLSEGASNAEEETTRQLNRLQSGAAKTIVASVPVSQ